MGVITDRRAGGVLPVLVWLRSYDRAWLPRDVLAGFVLTTVLVPVGISYAEAAGLPAVTGLYATVVPLLVYAAVGPSRHLILGPDSSLVPLIAATVLPLAAAGSDRAGELAAMLAVLAGAMCAASSLARVGYLTDLLSIPIRYGYLNGIALLIFVNQITAMCGLPGVTGGLVDGVRNLVDGIVDGGVDRTSLLLGLGAIAVILALRHWLPAVPAPLVVVIGGIVVVTAFDLASVAARRELPQGLPRPDVPMSTVTSSARSSPAPPASPWSPWPTRASCRARSRSARPGPSTPTGSWRRTASSTSQPASSRGSR